MICKLLRANTQDSLQKTGLIKRNIKVWRPSLITPVSGERQTPSQAPRMSSDSVTAGDGRKFGKPCQKRLTRRSAVFCSTLIDKDTRLIVGAPGEILRVSDANRYICLMPDPREPRVHVCGTAR